MLHVQQFSDIEQLDEIESVWSELLAETENADFFRTLDWLKVYWKHFGAGQSLKVLLVCDGDQPVGIVPLVVTLRKTKLGQFRVLGFPMDFWGSFYGAIGPNPAAIWEAALEHIMQEPRDWDYLDLRWFQLSTGESKIFEQAAAEFGHSIEQQADDEIAIADLSAGWDAYWASRSGNCRSNCRRNNKKVEAVGEVQYVRYRPAGEAHGESDPRWDLFAAVEEIAQRSWQARSTDGTTMTHEEICSFLKDMHVAAVRCGCLDLNLLYIDGKPVAFNYNYHYRGYVSSLRLGFDPQFAKAGVGTVLTHKMLEDSCARGDHTIDFLPGSHGVKRPWQTQLEASTRFEYLPRTSSRNNLLRAGRWVSRNWKTAFAAAK